MKNFLKSVFSAEIFFLILAAVAIYFVVGSVNAEKAKQAERQNMVSACFNTGMVLVHTDGGPRCALPANLIPLK